VPRPSSPPDSSRPSWFRLDNAAKLYPAINTGNRANVFRISALLKDPVDPVALQAALEEILPRFPTYAVRMHSGLFWHYLGHNPGCPVVLPDVSNPCMRMRFHEKPGFLFRVFHYDRRIAVEFFHALTDGSGGLVFLKTLLAAYLSRTGGGGREPGPFPPGIYGDSLLDPRGEPDAEEFEDAHARYAPLHVTAGRREPKAYHAASTAEPVHTLDTITGVIQLDRVLEVARGLKVSLTEYLAAVYIDVLCRLQRNELAQRRTERTRRPAPVRLQVPVNMRRFFASRTLRNFSYFVNINLEAANGDYDFHEILHIVHYTMRLGVDPKSLAAQIGQNVKPERGLWLRIAPLFIKNLVISEIYRRVGEPTSSGTMTNLGAVVLPPELAPAVDRFELALGPSFLNRTQCAVVSFENHLAVAFTRTCRETDIERGFFTKLVRDGIPVRIESNR